MQRRRCGVRNHEDEHPTTFTSARRPNDRVNVVTRDGEEDLLTYLTSPVFPRSLLSPGFDAPRRRGSQNATRRARDHCGSPASRGVRTLSLAVNGLQQSNTSPSDMKYSPPQQQQQQQQQQKQRKSESSDAASMDATLSRTSASGTQEQRKASSTSSSTRAPRVCRSPSTGMFAWMRVFRLASMLHQVGC